ncbi:MAG: hypothetical protein ACJ8AG_29015 [Ktedonobacteraceae bacterium]
MQSEECGKTGTSHWALAHVVHDLRTGVDMVGQISKGQATDELNERAEGFLWEAMESFFKLSQLIALPAKPVQPPHNTSGGMTHQQQAPSGYISQRPDLAVPAQPSPNVSDLLNQVIAGPGATIEAPAQASQDVSDLINQVTAGPGAPIEASSQPSPDVSDLLNQVTADPGMAQDRATQDLKKDACTPGRERPASKPTSRDDTLDMLSEICGEQQTNDEQ